MEARIGGRSEASTLQLLETLYPNTPEPQAEALLRQLVFQTRGSLGQEVIVTTSGGYALGLVGTDAEEFLRSGNPLLWRGAYRADLDGEPDEAVFEALYRALANQVRELIRTHPLEAARLGKILLEANPYHLEYLTLTLRASNHHKSLSRLYAQAKERMLEVGETLPATWQEFLEPA